MKRKVEAWACIGKNGEFYASLRTERFAKNFIEGENLKESTQTVPCFLTYELPKKPKRGKAK